jgi:signal transduction histidine kinase
LNNSAACTGPSKHITPNPPACLVQSVLGFAVSSPNQNSSRLFDRICLILLIFLSNFLFSSCQQRLIPGNGTIQIREVRHLSPARLREGLSVKVEGVVTIYDDQWHLLVVQDQTGGIAVDVQGSLFGISQGDRVNVEGFTAFEGNSPLIVKPKVQKTGVGTLPLVQMADPAKLFQGGLDYHLVRVTGTIRSFRIFSQNHVEMDADWLGHRYRVYVRYFVTSTPSIQIGKILRLPGVPVTTYDPSGRIHSLQFYGEGNEVEILEQSPSERSSNALPQTVVPVLTSIRSIKDLTNQEAARGFPVMLHAIVTLNNIRNPILIIQDATGGIYVEPLGPGSPKLQPGDLIEISGWTASGSFAPLLRPGPLKILGRGPLPAPLRVLPSEGFRGVEENRWVELEGVIRVARPDGVQLQMVCGTTRIPLNLVTPLPPESSKALVDSHIRAKGVYSSDYTGDGWLLGFNLWINSARDITVLASPQGDTFQSTARPVHSLMEYSSTGFSRHRLKVEGIITYIGSSGVIYLADNTSGIRLDGNTGTSVRLNDCVQVLGFLSNQVPQPILEDVELKAGIASPSVSAVPIQAVAAFSGRYGGQLVQLEGFLREKHRSFGDWVFTMESGRYGFTARLELPQSFPGWEELREGALLHLTGVCENHWNTNTAPPTPVSFQLLLRTPQDLVIIRKASWWTLGRALMLLGTLGGLLLLGSGWVYLLRRRVRVQMELLHHQMEQREVLESQLRQAQKLESVGRLAGGVAHDFNNLLTVINGYSEVLLSELEADDEKALSVGEIKKAGEKAALLTRQLLAFSRKQILQPEVLDLNVLVGDMEKMLRRLIGEDIELATHLNSGSCRVKADPGQISQVLMNLTINARDAMPEGGKLIIETSRVYIDETLAASHPEMPPGEYVLLVISDTGIGMDSETRSHLFEPFFTTKGLGKGTGLGLPMVFGIVKQSGGHIWVYSEPHMGTTFKIYLPHIGDENMTSSPPSSAVAHSGWETLLVVEDESEVRQLIVKTLAGLGYRVLEKSNSEEALQCAQEHNGPIHLLLTDVVMPGSSGKILAEQLASLRPGIRVLFMSGYTENVIAHKGILDPGIEYIPKPFSPAALATRIRELLDRDS